MSNGDIVRKKGVILDDNTPTESRDLFTDAVEAFIVLRDAMQLSYLVHNKDFREMAEKHDINYDKSLVRAVQFVLADHPHSIRCIHENEHSAYEGFRDDDMKAFVILQKKIMILALMVKGLAALCSLARGISMW